MPLPTDDLLSAFHDGEVTSAERAAVEQQLAESATTRRELAEIQQVSALLKELPRERLPSEFPQQVLQAIEREMLIPSQPIEPVTVTSKLSRSGLSQSGANRRWVGAVAVLTSAAGLFLLVRAVDDHGSDKRPAVRQLAESTSAKLAQSESSDAPAGFGGRTPSPMSATFSDLSRDSEVLSKSVAAGPEAGVRTSGISSSADETLFESANLRFDRSSLRDAKIGDAIAAMRTEGTEVAVVWVTVVDRQEGLAGLQFLLANKLVARTKPRVKSEVAAKETDKDTPEQLHAVFVESNPEQLTAAMQQLRKEDFFQTLEIDLPIELAQLNDVGNGQSIGNEAFSRRVASLQVASKADSAKSLPRTVADESRVVPPGNSLAEKKSASAGSALAPKASAPAAKEPLDSNRQMQMPITLDLSRETLTQNSLNLQTRNRVSPRNLTRGLVEDAKAGAKAADEQRPMHVLFVVVEQPPAGKQASPINAPKSNVPAKTRTEPPKPVGQDGAA